MTIGFQNFLIISSIQSSKGDFMIEDLLELVGRQRENCQNYVKMLKLERNRITVMLVILHLFVAVLIFLMGYIFCKLQSFEFMMRAIYLCTHFGTFVNIFTSEAMNHEKFQLLLFLSNLIRSLSAFLKKKTVKVEIKPSKKLMISHPSHSQPHCLHSNPKILVSKYLAWMVMGFVGQRC